MNPQYFESQIRVAIVKEFPVRSTLLPTKTGAVLISPIKFNDSQIKTLKQFNVTDIVAPSDIHHLFVLDAHKIFPNAKLWKVEGLERKRSDVSWTGTLGVDRWPHNEIKVFKIEGAEKLNEHVFLHEPSKTLVVTDLMFNIRNPKGLGAKIILTLGGAYDRMAVSRLWKIAVKNKAKFIASLQRLFEHDFDRIAVAHGEIIERNGKQLLKEALSERGFNI